MASAQTVIVASAIRPARRPELHVGPAERPQGARQAQRREPRKGDRGVARAWRRRAAGAGTGDPPALVASTDGPSTVAWLLSHELGNTAL